MNFPFNEQENVAVFTCCHIIREDSDIYYVSHDEDDGAWQFLCNLESHQNSDANIVSLKQIFELDNSIGELANMPLGSYATRVDKNSPWKEFRR